MNVEVDIDPNCITRIMKSLGMDLNSQVEGCQVQFNWQSQSKGQEEGGS